MLAKLVADVDVDQDACGVVITDVEDDRGASSGEHLDLLGRLECEGHAREAAGGIERHGQAPAVGFDHPGDRPGFGPDLTIDRCVPPHVRAITARQDRKSTRLNLQSLMRISYAVFCLKKKKTSFNFMYT